MQNDRDNPTPVRSSRPAQPPYETKEDATRQKEAHKREGKHAHGEFMESVFECSRPSCPEIHLTTARDKGMTSAAHSQGVRCQPERTLEHDTMQRMHTEDSPPHPKHPTPTRRKCNVAEAGECEQATLEQ